jgi:hypothetical protein
MPQHPNTVDWQAAYQTASAPSPRDTKILSHRLWALLAVLVLPLAFALEIIKDTLDELHILNTNPLWPVAPAALLSWRDYATHSTVWEIATYGMMLGSVPIFLWGFVVLARQSKNPGRP